VISDKTVPSPSAKLQTTLLKLGQRILWSSGIVREYGETENTWHARARPRRLDGNQMFCLLGAHPTDTPITTLGYDIHQLPRSFPDFSMLSIVPIIVSAAHSGWAVRHSCQSLARQSLRWEIRSRPSFPTSNANPAERSGCLVADKSYHGHYAPPLDYKFRIYISGQRRGLTDVTKRDIRRRSAVEPVIGHLKDDHRMGRNYFASEVLA
jgi:hypothetical protein